MISNPDKKDKKELRFSFSADWLEQWEQMIELNIVQTVT